jgi:hypothetical protein
MIGGSIGELSIGGWVLPDDGAKVYPHKKKNLQKLRREADQLAAKYNAAVITAKNNKQAEEAIISATDAYISPLTSEETERRARAFFVFEEPAPAQRIDFDAMLANQYALDALRNALILAEQRITDQIDDELLFIAMLASM